MNIKKTLSELKQYAGIFELYHKTTFEGYRKYSDDGNQKINISIFDAGMDVGPDIRYHCDVESEDGKMATGNPASSIKLALLNVHWNELD